MLRKLLKYEFTATGRTMLPLYAALLATALGAGFSISIPWVGAFFRVTLMILFFLMLTAVWVVVFVVMVQRFSRNLLGDEGYLMLTLPVSVHKQVWSKLTVSAVWFALTLCVVTLAVAVQTQPNGLLHLLGDMWSFLVDGFRLLTGGEAVTLVTFIAEGVGVSFLWCCALCLQVYAALAVGHSFANRKTLWSVGAFLLLSTVINWAAVGVLRLCSATGLDYTLSQLTANGALLGVHLGMAVLAAGAVLYGGVSYFLTVYFLKHRLNLE